MPDDNEALLNMFDAFQRLQELGWRDIIYCPKDGTHFDAIEAGSTGIHNCWYQGTWPKGIWWGDAANDIWPMHPILFRLKSTGEIIGKIAGGYAANPDLATLSKTELAEHAIAQADAVIRAEQANINREE